MFRPIGCGYSYGNGDGYGYGYGDSYGDGYGYSNGYSLQGQPFTENHLLYLAVMQRK